MTGPTMSIVASEMGLDKMQNNRELPEKAAILRKFLYLRVKFPQKSTPFDDLFIGI